MLTNDRTGGRKRPGSNFALAIALLCGTALTAGVIETPAAAQKKKKKDEETKKNYSQDFIKAYTAANDLMNAEPADMASATAAVPGVIAAVETADDRLAAGQLMVNVGQRTENNTLTRQGLELMIESGRLPADRAASYMVNAGGLAQRDDDYETARKHFMAAHDAGYRDEDLPPIIAQTYFLQNRDEEGISYLRGMIDAQAAAGQIPARNWIDVAFTNAYNNDRALDAINLSALAVEHYPDEKNWRNAIAVQRNLVTMTDDVVLDLMRLGKQTGTLQDGRDYADYIEAADARRLPGEVETILNEAVASGALKSNDPFVVDVREVVDGRLAADKADLPILERDAAKPGATAVTTSAAGDVFLSYGDAAKAEAIYEVAATKPGVDKDRVMTRLGIAQVEQGKFAEASQTFDKVGGQRAAVAALWKAYAVSQMNGAASTATPL